MATYSHFHQKHVSDLEVQMAYGSTNYFFGIFRMTEKKPLSIVPFSSNKSFNLLRQVISLVPSDHLVVTHVIHIVVSFQAFDL